VLSTLAAALIFATEAENWSSSNYQRMLNSATPLWRFLEYRFGDMAILARAFIYSFLLR
jgi:hypothetical protein